MALRYVTLLVVALPLLLAACSGGSGDTVQRSPDDVTDQRSERPADTGPAPDVACTENVHCDDGNPCTEEHCGWSGNCEYQVLVDAPCDDGDACTTGDSCNAEGLCLGGAPRNCDDLDDCTADHCAPETGCQHSPAEDGTACDDGLLCTAEDACLAGVCSGTAPLCDDGNDCTANSCDETTGECTYIAQSNFPCDDGNACTNNDICQEGLCQPGNSIDCDDANPCTADDCLAKPRAQGGGCRHEPLVGDPCDDANPCTAEDQCTDDGGCIGLTIDCDDGNPCTTDACTPPDGCYHEPASGEPCDDQDPCTGEGKCLGGICQPGPAVDCDDDVACTVDSCDEDGACLHEPDDSLCDDGLFCNGAETCDPEQDCLPGEELAIDDGFDCTTDACNEQLQLVQHLPQHDLCDDGNPCTIDACDLENGCVNSDKLCDDQNPCTEDGCDPDTGNCTFTPQGECCLVNSDCVDEDPCQGGYCHTESLSCSFHPLLCDDYDPCTADSCTEGCLHEAIADCQDECAKDLDCFFAMGPVKDLCAEPACVQDPESGAMNCEYGLKNCDDGRACTLDLCDPALGCQFLPLPWCAEPCASDADCQDGDACSDDLCVDGFCANSVDLCDDGLACTGGECNWQTGECVLFECVACQCPTCESDADCNDGNLCTNDVCYQETPGDPGLCRHLQAPCQDGNPCTNDFCLPTKGCVHILDSQCIGCQADVDCDDGNPATSDLCLPEGCSHGPD